MTSRVGHGIRSNQKWKTVKVKQHNEVKNCNPDIDSKQSNFKWQIRNYTLWSALDRSPDTEVRGAKINRMRIEKLRSYGQEAWEPETPWREKRQDKSKRFIKSLVLCLCN